VDDRVAAQPRVSSRDADATVHRARRGKTRGTVLLTLDRASLTSTSTSRARAFEHIVHPSTTVCDRSTRSTMTSRATTSAHGATARRAKKTIVIARVVTCTTSAPPKPRVVIGTDRVVCSPARVSAAQRRRRGRRGGSDEDARRESLDDGDGGGDDWFGGRGGDGGGGGGGGDDESGDDEDDFEFAADELSAFELALFRDMEMSAIDAHALYAWQSACAVTLVGCVQHVIDTAHARARESVVFA